jgi:hypothetical protein
MQKESCIDLKPEPVSTEPVNEEPVVTEYDTDGGDNTSSSSSSDSDNNSSSSSIDYFCPINYGNEEVRLWGKCNTYCLDIYSSKLKITI